MLQRTWSDIKTEIIAEMDMEGEDFVSATEMIGYANDAIDEAEAQILLLYQDYFRRSYDVPLVDGEDEYVLPDDIFANKMRWIQYNDGNEIYKVKRITLEQIAEVEDEDWYRYDIIHNSADEGYRLMLFPASRVTNTGYMKIWYIRNANRIEDDFSVIDIPEFTVFVKNYVKHEIAIKEQNPMLPKLKEKLETSRANMLQTLADMVPDEENDIEQDTSFYDELN